MAVLACALAFGAGQAYAQSADSVALQPGSFEKVVLVEDVTNPIEMAIAPDHSVFFVERQGAVRRWDAGTETTSLIGFIPVNNRHEDGILGITLDPNFAENGWVYIYYSPAGPEEVNVLSRFTFDGEHLAPGSEKIMLEVPTQRVECCHTGGSLAFGPQGNLYLSTGDNTNPFASDGFAPIDERPGREPWDAQRSSANTNDLRGKILRIRPQPDGAYTIPEGNLFVDDDPLTRPEIYTMGHRNPYRIAVDQETGWLYWGEVGPDAGAPLEGRGPAGHDEFNRAKQPGNFGWPYFIGDNKPYNEYDFTTQESGPLFQPNRPINDSPNNTGTALLPPTQPAFLWYPYGPSEEFPELGVGGRTAQGGPVYHYDPATVHEHGLPEYFDNTWFIYEWARNWIKEVKLDENGEIRDINALFPDLTFIRPMDVEIGPDGRLYVIEWGDAFWGVNENARIVRLDYYGSPERPPVAMEPAAKPDVVDGNARPEVTITWPVDGGFFEYGQPIRYEVEVDDREDGQITGATVVVTPVLGRDSHELDLQVQRGNTGSFTIYPYDYVHWNNQYVALEARYEDRGAGEAGVLVGSNRIILQPSRKQAEHTFSREGVTQEMTGDIRTRENLGLILEAADGAVLAYAPINLKNIESLTFRVKPEAGGVIEVRQDAPDGPKLAEVTVPSATDAAAADSTDATGDVTTHDEEMHRLDDQQAPEGWLDLTVPITDPGGTHTLYLVFRGEGDEAVAALDWLQFNGRGIAGLAE